MELNEQEGIFKNVATIQKSSKWEKSIKRIDKIYQRANDIRSEFARDYNRILHSNAYRRMKHKTQVFFSPSNDHICTRIEHVTHVVSVSYTIAKFLGLNTELTNAIAIGHDLGHPPFGHAGERVLKSITEKDLDEKFWHEKNSLRFIDKCETLEDDKGFYRNLNLTYAVRDGIICHCGEVDDNGLVPRNKSIDLDSIKSANQVTPYTWEGCVVKIADKISYLGRDIEDAITLKILSSDQSRELSEIIKQWDPKAERKKINNTVIMHDFIIDLCSNSNPEKGIHISDANLQIMNSFKQFNYKNIYEHWRLDNYKKYAELVLKTIYDFLKGVYDSTNTLKNLKKHEKIYPELVEAFSIWLIKYSNTLKSDKHNKYCNKTLYSLEHEKDYYQAVLDFISGMTDSFVTKIFNEITMF